MGSSFLSIEILLTILVILLTTLILLK